MVRFLELSLTRAGADSMITPREMLRDYMTILNILLQNKDATFEEIVGATVAVAENTENEERAENTPKRAGEYTANDIEF